MITLRDRIQAFSPYFPHAGALLLITALGLGVGFFKTDDAAAVGAGQEQWLLPQWKPFRADAQLKAMAAAKVWIEDAQPQDADAAAARRARGSNTWRFVGTVREGDALVAVIELPDAGKVQRLAVGQAMPDGSTVTAIVNGEVTTTFEGESRTLRLFEDIPTEAKPAANQPRRRNARR